MGTAHLVNIAAATVAKVAKGAGVAVDKGSQIAVAARPLLESARSRITALKDETPGWIWVTLVPAAIAMAAFMVIICVVAWRWSDSSDRSERSARRQRRRVPTIDPDEDYHWSQASEAHQWHHKARPGARRAGGY